MKDLGYSYSEIAKTLNISKSYAFKIYEKSLKSRLESLKYIFTIPGRIIEGKVPYRKDEFGEKLCGDCKVIYEVEQRRIRIVNYSLIFYFLMFMILLFVVL